MTRKKILFSIMAISILTTSLFSQTMFLHSVPTNKPKVEVRYIHPYFPDVNFSTLSGIYDLNIQMPIRTDLSIEASIPYIYFDAEDYDKKKCFKNIYLGVQYVVPDNFYKFIYSLGYNIPSKTKTITYFDIETDNYRYYKYTNEYHSVYGKYCILCDNKKNYLKLG